MHVLGLFSGLWDFLKVHKNIVYLAIIKSHKHIELVSDRSPTNSGTPCTDMGYGHTGKSYIPLSSSMICVVSVSRRLVVHFTGTLYINLGDLCNLGHSDAWMSIFLWD